MKYQKIATLLTQNGKRNLLQYYFVIYLQKVVAEPLLVQIFQRVSFLCIRPNIFEYGLKLLTNLYSICFAQKVIRVENILCHLGNQNKNSEKYKYIFQVVEYFMHNGCFCTEVIR